MTRRVTTGGPWDRPVGYRPAAAAADFAFVSGGTSAAHGPVVDGPVVDGPVVDGPVVDGPVVDEDDAGAQTAGRPGIGSR